MSIASEIVARLQAQAGDSFSIIGTAAEYQRVAEKPRAAPAAYVVPVFREAAPTALANRIRQTVRIGHGVVIVTSDLSTPGTGGAAADDADGLSDIVVAALLGWTPASAAEPIQYAGGGLIDSKGGHVWWQDDFVCSRLYSQA